MSNLAAQAAAARLVREIRTSAAQLAHFRARIELLDIALARQLPACSEAACLLLKQERELIQQSIDAAEFPSCVPTT